MDITLDYKEQTSNKRNSFKNRRNGLVNIEDVVVNVKTQNESVIKSQSADIEEIEYPDHYYIISENSLLPALRDLASWKTQKGYQVTVKAIEDIYNDDRYKINPYTGIMDDAASLRKYLQDEYEENGTFFCLLVGDHRTKMPIRKLTEIGKLDTSESDIYGDDYVPTDDYFSDLSKDGWSLYKKNDIYVSDVTNSFNPYIYVGRLLCNNTEEICNYIKKLILYETNPGKGDSSYLNNSLIAVQESYKSCYPDVLASMNNLFENVECILDSKIENPDSRGFPNGEYIINKMNSCGFSSWHGHGEPCTQAFSGRTNHESEWLFVKALQGYRTKGESEYEYESQINNRH